MEGKGPIMRLSPRTHYGMRTLWVLEGSGRWARVIGIQHHVHIVEHV